ncbi:MAG: hypothetical protein JAZ17_08380 [Candidatus Thiodiazotropha endolucinida]|nr:hypothetical protein [Candidatus Thiodiazotropha endolucinida]
MTLFSRYQGVGTILSRYWNAYGGWKEVAISPYFHISVVITLLSANFWINGDWATVVANIIPSLLGFSLGGYAILLGFGNEKFLASLSKPRKNTSSADETNNPLDEVTIYVSVNASFVHFIILQIIALVFVLIYKSAIFDVIKVDKNNFFLTYYSNYPLHLSFIENTYSFFTYLIFTYAILSAIAVTLNIFRLATWYNLFNLKNRSVSSNHIRNKLKHIKSSSKDAK